MKLEQIKQSVKALGLGNSFKATQRQIERFQLSIAKKENTLNNKVKQGLREVEQIKERETEAKKLGIKLASDFTPLLHIYTENLANLTEAELLSQFVERAGAMKAKLPDNLAEVQSPIIDRYYQIQAETSLQGVKNIQAFLQAKGLLKDAPVKEAKAVKQTKQAVKEEVAV